MERSNRPSTPRVRDLTATVPVNKGGTGAQNVYDAAINLGGINLTKLDVANGIAKADSSGLLPSSILPDATVYGPTLGGSTQLSINQTTTFKITNYDSNTSYTISASGGAVISRVDDTITYTAPGVIGNYTITVSGKVFNLYIGAIRPAAPTLAGSTTGNSTSAQVDMAGSTFAMVSGSGTHASSDWELYSDITLTNLVGSSLIDSNNKLGYSVQGLALSTTYYGRLRYRDTNNQVSDWSNTLTITTLADYLPASEEAKVTQVDVTTTTTETLFLKLISIDSTGNRVAVGNWTAHPSGSAQTGQGLVYVYVRNGSTWTRETTLQASDPTTNAYLGLAVQISADGQRVIAGAFNKTQTYGTQGAAYIWVRNTTTNVWTQEQKLIQTDPIAANEYYGYAVAISSDGTRCAIGAEGHNSSRGAVYVYLRTGSTWTQEQKIIASDPTNSAFFAVSLAMTPDATRMVVGAYNLNSGAVSSGAVYVYSRSGTVWTQEQKVVPPDPVASGYFGGNVAIDSTGTRMVIASDNRTDGVANCGAVYVFLRTNTLWALEAKLNASNKAAGDAFGSSVAMNASGSTLIVGAYKSDPAALSNAGQVYLFTRNGTTWTETNIITASDRAASNGFGSSVTITPDGTRTAVAASFRTNPYYLASYIYS
jgi:hypothetical protein